MRDSDGAKSLYKMTFSYTTASTPRLTLSDSPTTSVFCSWLQPDPLSVTAFELSCVFQKLVWWFSVGFLRWGKYLLEFSCFFLNVKRKIKKKKYHKQKLQAHLHVIGEQKMTNLQLNQGLLTENKNKIPSSGKQYFVSALGVSYPEWVLPSLKHHTWASFLCPLVHFPL